MSNTTSRAERIELPCGYYFEGYGPSFCDYFKLMYQGKALRCGHFERGAAQALAAAMNAAPPIEPNAEKFVSKYFPTLKAKHDTVMRYELVQCVQDALEQALAASQRPKSEWQRIRTALKDGTEIEVYCPDRPEGKGVSVVWWDGTGWAFYSDGFVTLYIKDNLTMWRSISYPAPSPLNDNAEHSAAA